MPYHSRLSETLTFIFALAIGMGLPILLVLGISYIIKHFGAIL